MHSPRRVRGQRTGVVFFAALSLALGACQCAGTNQPPEVAIDSPRDGEVLRGAGPFSLVGRVTDPDELIGNQNIVWSSDRQGVLGNGAVVSTPLLAGAHRLRLHAADSQGATSSAEISVTVVTDVATNTPPVATIDAPVNGALFDEGQPITLRGHATDAEDGMLGGASLAWTSDVAGALGTGAELVFNNAARGRHRIVLTATDSRGESAVATIELEVVLPGTNRPPSVTITAPQNGATLTLGAATTLTGSATDVEDGPLSGAALAWSSSRDGALGTGASLAVTLTQGVHVLTLTATDSMSATGTASVTVSVNAPNNQPPVATITAPANNTTFFHGTSLTLTGTGVDPEDGPLSGAALAWSSSRDGALGTGSPLTTSTLTAGDHVVTLVARDSGGNTGTATLTLHVLPMNAAPTVAITAPANNTQVVAGTPLTFTATASDAEDGVLGGAAVRWSSSLAGALGTGTSLTTASLVEGVHTITVTATDSGGRSASASITVTVTPGAMNLPPVARLTGPTQGQATQTLTFDGSTSSDPDGTIAAWRFEFSDGSPAVTGMNQTPHVFAAAGTYTVTLTVTDDRGATGTTSLTVNVSPFVRVPVVVDVTDENASAACGLAARGTTLHVAWFSARHPTLWYATYSGGTLSKEVVDSLGFNLGGRIGGAVQLALDASGTPHVVYLRDDQVWYAKKVSGAWVRERVDTASLPVYLSAGSPPALALESSGRVGVAYETYSSYSRTVVAFRAPGGGWTQAMVPVTGLGTAYTVRHRGDVLFDAAGRLLLPLYVSTSTVTGSYLASYDGTATEVFSLGGALPGLTTASSLAWAGTNRLYLLGGTGLFDITVGAPLSSSSARMSYLEASTTSQHGVAATSTGAPRIVINHGSTLESVWPLSTPGFWDRFDLGATDSGLIDAAVDGNDDTRACFFRAGKLVLY
ncbi:MAG: PKD domain-containing protein [Myxococcota bacterium]